MNKFQKILHPEKFNLILYYTTTSFIVIGLLSISVGWVFARMESKELIKRSEKYAQNFIEHINFKIYKEFLVPTLKSDKQIDLENNSDQFHRLDTIIRENLYGLNIKKLYLYNLEGGIIYSTVQEHIGYAIEHGKNKKLDSAISGIPASALRVAGTIDSKGAYVEESLLESYYPFYEMDLDGEKKVQVGVLEIYQDMSVLKRQIARARKKAMIMTSSAMGILFLILFLIVLKAAKIINARTKQLTDARNTLEQNVAERTLEIRKAYKELQHTQRKLVQTEKLASIGTLITGLAHEINNPLASVASCAEGLTERMKALTEQNGHLFKVPDLDVFPEYLKIICDETYRCKSIISNLLNFSRQSDPKFEKVNVNTIILDTLAITQHQFKSNNKRIRLNLSEEPCDVFGDSQQLKQVFLNLIINSLHATEESGDILISTHKELQMVQINFTDSGIGIKPEHLDKIFDPFFTTKPTGKGTGIGLAVCYGIIDVHNGRIEAFSEGTSRGTTFKIYLPLMI